MEGVSTDPLQALATKWSLAGDDQLLHLLQSTHQRIISKCQAVNSKLEEMASALDDASINLQNVNNKFMALSNSQFIESRVYDDDADLAADTPPIKEPPRPSPTDEVAMLKNSLSILERAHDTAEILDDSDSDSDAEISVVLKPKDMYSHRPLPYIIGSQPWKNKWHAGLIEEDSDTDSSTSKQDRDIEQYSDSEEEMCRPPLEEHTLSESSSSLPGSLGAPPQAPGAPPAARPADIAAELARRLAGDAQTIVREETEEYLQAAHTQGRKVYKPEQPATSAIFSDEPPPLEESSDQSSDEDIFAEINKHTPYTQRNKVQTNLAEDLFSFEKPAVEQGDIFSDFAPTRVEKSYAKPKSTLFEGELEAELFAEPPPKKEIQIKNAKEIQNNNVDKDEPSTKKPVGGISLFGSNKGAESIGAAILHRNQRKSTISGDESGSDDVNSRTDNSKKQIQRKPKVLARNSDITEPKATTSKAIDETDTQSTAKKEKDIFEDLFSKSEKIQKKSPQIAKQPTKVTHVKEEVAAVKEKEKTNVKDLFSDNIFDDIDDIFTSNVKIPTKKTNQKSIFDDDDLFFDNDIAKSTNQSGKDDNESIKDNKTNLKHVKTSIKNTKSIFDSDDELFSETKTDAEKPVTKNIESHVIKDNLTRNKNETEIQIQIQSEINSEVIPQIENIKKPTGTTKERNLFDDSPQIVKPNPKTQMISKTIFDSDSDDDIFAKLKTPDRKINQAENVASSKNYNKMEDTEHHQLKSENNSNKNQLTTKNIKGKEKDSVQSPSLFEEDEIDDLFVAANKLKETNENNDTKVRKVENLPEIVKEPVIENLSKVNENYTSINVADTEKTNLPKSVKDPESDTKNDSIPNKDIVSGKTDIFDDNLREDDLFSAPKDVLKNKSSDKVTEIADIIEPSQKINESETKEATKSDSKTITELPFEDTRHLTVETERETKMKKYEIENVNQSVFDDLIEPAKEKEALTTELKIPVSKTGIFDDIFTEPPAFEKVAEPKKSKNINALFDDDSDDESLFFKKNDVISDEKPDVFSKNANFDIFVDEPPAIDVDFTTKPAKNTDIENDLFIPVQKTDNLVQSTKTLNDEEDIISLVPEKNQIVSKFTENIDTNYGDELFSSVEERVPKSIDFDNCVDFISVPEKQKNVPDSDKVIEQKTKDDKSKISNDITEIPAQSNVFERIEDKELFSPKIDKTYNTIEKTIVLSKVLDSDDELFASLPNLPAPSQKDKNDSLNSDQNILKSNAKKNKTDDFDDILKSEPKKDTEIKKIGKLNTKNFNINVNALIPGASPKKIPKERQDEHVSEIEEPKIDKIIPGELNPTNNKDVNEVSGSNIKAVNFLSDETDYKSKYSDKDENNVNDQQDPKTAKSITFDKKSEVLDNNLSKQRPRIQVKRRPSSRRARHEAVRKSVVDFSDDTDNSSSFDEPKPSKGNVKEVEKHDNDEKHHDSENFSTSNTSTNKVIYDIKKEDLSKELNLNTKPILKDNTDITKEEYKNTQSEVNSDVKSDIFDSMLTNLPPHKAVPSISSEIKKTRQNINENKQTTTKIVYILNDEDIFNTDSKNTQKKENNMASETTDIIKSTEGVQTLGKSYKNNTEKKNKEELTPKLTEEEIKNSQITPTKDVKSYKSNKTSLFDDSDEELFNKNKKTAKKTTIFDSDSEEDLFSGKKSTEKKNKEVRNREVKERKEVVVKGSLFGDDDDDDDLFGIKKNKNEPKHQSSTPSTSKEASLATASKSAERVFDDPLSMLGDD